MTAQDVTDKLSPGKSRSASSRFLGALQGTGMGYGTIQLPMNLWTVDGTNPPLYEADYGTDGTSQNPIQGLGSDSDDFMFNRCYVPLDYNPEKGELWFCGTFHSVLHDNSVFMEWNVNVAVVPTSISIGSTEEYTTNVKIDTAGTSSLIVDLYNHETTLLTKSLFADLTDGVTPKPGDWLGLTLWNDNSDSDVIGSVWCVGACIHYSR